MAEPTGLSTEQLGALAVLKGVKALSRFYLAGGSAIASHLAHRRSIDLDLFSREPDADLGELALSSWHCSLRLRSWLPRMQPSQSATVIWRSTSCATRIRPWRSQHPDRKAFQRLGYATSQQ